jgi:hypothetical protein
VRPAPENRGVFIILAGLKLRLMLRALTRGGGFRGAVLLLLVAAAFAPIWLGLTSAAYSGALHLGAPAVITGFGLIQLSWIGASVLLGSFAEGFDLRLLLRYPVPPVTAFWLNVLVAPVDFVAFFLLPPLGGLAVGTATRAGLPAGIAIALAGILVLFVTTAIAQSLLALLGRHLRREWTRALFGLLIGVIFAVPGIMLRNSAHANSGVTPAAALAWLKSGLPAVAHAFSWFPGTAMPARGAVAAINGQWLAAAAWLVAAAGALLLLVRICARLVVSEAMNREIAPSGGDEGAARPRLETWFERLLPTDLALLVARELRTYVRTPQILLGLFTSPLLVVLFSRQHDLGMRGGTFVVALAPLITALNLASNQFGLDQAGVRLLFLLPIAARRLLIAKNIACTTVTLAGAVVCLLTTVVAGPHLDVLGTITTLATLAAALPVVLTFGNHLSVRSPWRMSFRLGGAPPGAMSSAFAQMAAVGVVAVALAPGLLLLPAIYGDGTGVRLISLWITATIAAGLWTAWVLLLPRTARALEQRRELIIDRLAKASEVG